MNKELERELNWLYDLAYNVVNPANKEDTDNAYKTIKESLERLEKLEKVVNDFLEYLSKESNRTIPKHSIKQTFDKLLKEVFGE